MPISRQDLRRAVAAHHHLFRDPNVLSIGIGHKQEDGRRTSRLALVVTVRQKERRSKRVPEGYRVPARALVGRDPRSGRPRYLPTDVVAAAPKSFSATAKELAGDAIRVQGGNSVGTLGGFVRDQDGNWYLLSCAHVMTDYCRLKTIGTAILAHPSGTPLGELTRFSRLRPGVENPADVAIARVSDPALLAELPSAAPIASGVTTVAVGDVVIVHGAVSIQHAGHVTQTNVSERVFGWGGIATEYCIMTNHIEVAALGDEGDSGGLVTDTASRAAGLFVGDNGALDLVMPIGTALSVAGSPDRSEHASSDNAQLQLSLL